MYRNPVFDAPLEGWQRDKGLARDSWERLMRVIEDTMRPEFMDEMQELLEAREGNCRHGCNGSPCTSEACTFTCYLH